jgi:hypothetical protein
MYASALFILTLCCTVAAAAITPAGTGALHVTVLDSAGTWPLANVTLSLSPMKGIGNSGNGQMDDKKTDAYGVAVFDTLSAGRYLILASSTHEPDRRLVSMSLMAIVKAGQTTYIKIRFGKQQGTEVPDEPEYKMRNVQPDTSVDDRMRYALPDSVRRLRTPLLNPGYPKVPPPDYPPVRKDSLQ